MPKGLSPELSKIYPHLNIVHYSLGFSSRCDLTSQQCPDITDRGASLISSENGWEVEEFTPRIDTLCEECPINKQSNKLQVKQTNEQNHSRKKS